MKNLIPAALLAMAAVCPLGSHAQMPPGYIEKMIDYAKCIRANGYADFPDPSADGHIQIKIDPQSAPKFEAAQRACKDKAPAGAMGMDQPMTPERMQGLLAFAKCVRDNGVSWFPDPTPQGVFEINDPKADFTSPQAQQAAKVCRDANSSVPIMIRRTMPK